MIMSTTTLGLDERLRAYLVEVSVREPTVLARLRAETALLSEARMQISPEQGQLMALLVRLVGARRVLEVGTFTGYSSLCMALALPAEGRILTCDVSEEWTRVARRYWREAQVEGQIELRLQPALDTLDELAEASPASFDLAFIDADKERYATYYERALVLVRRGGLILIDNTLWSGKVADERQDDPSTRAIRELNRALRDDQRVDLSLLPIGDGLTLLRVR
jgi:predicted O-methyltransferase YrrM